MKYLKYDLCVKVNCGTEEKPSPGQLKKVLTEDVLAVLAKYGVGEEGASDG